MAKVQDWEEQSPEARAMYARSRSAAAIPLRLRLLRRVTSIRIYPHSIGLFLLALRLPFAMGQSPALTSPVSGSVLPGASATFTWTAVKDASSYKLMLGITPENFGHLGTYTRGSTSASTISVRATGLPTNGQIVYASLTWVIGGHAYIARSAYIAAFKGTSSAPAIGSLSCAAASLTGSGTDLCTVKLNVAAGKGGSKIELASSESAAVVPNSVRIPAGGKIATFKAEIAAVDRAQTAVLMATDGRTSKTCPIKLKAGSSVLELESKSIAFGDVNVSSPSTQSLRLTSTGTNPLVIDSAKTAGKGFKLSGPRFPVKLNPGKFETLDLEFAPEAAGKVSGDLTIGSNSVTGSSTVIPLSGTGQGGYEVKLNWNAPVGPGVAIAGYRVYRAAGGSTDYDLLNESLDPDTSYTDDSVESGADYFYYVETVNEAGAASVPSTLLSVAVP